MYANMLDQLRLCVGRSGDENCTGVGNRFRDGVKIVVIRRGVPAADRVCLVMDMPGRMVRVQNEPFDIFRIEMEHTCFTVINPVAGVIMMRVHECFLLRSLKKSGARNALRREAILRNQSVLSKFSSSWEFRYMPDIGSTQQRWS